MAYWNSSRLPSASPDGTYSLSGTNDNVATKTSYSSIDQHLEGDVGYNGTFRRYFEVKFTRNATYRSWHDFVIGFCTQNSLLSELVGNSETNLGGEIGLSPTGKGVRSADTSNFIVYYDSNESFSLGASLPVSDTAPVTVGILLDAGYTDANKVEFWIVVNGTIYGASGATVTPTQVSDGQNGILNYVSSDYLYDWSDNNSLLYPAVSLYEIGATAELLMTDDEFELLATLPTGYSSWNNAVVGIGGAVAGGSASVETHDGSRVVSAAGGGVVGGSASFESHYISAIIVTITGGAIAGGTATIETEYGVPVSGGAIAGGSATMSFGHIRLNGSLGLNGEMNAVYWLNEITGSIGLDGGFSVGQENSLSVSGSIGLYGTITATHPMALSLLGGLGLSGSLGAQQSKIVSMDGAIGLDGTVSIVNENLLTINGSIGLSSDISFIVDNSSSYSLSLHNSDRWT